MKKKAVFLDIDGTLLLRDGTMPESAKEALARATERGHEMVLCTGRSPSQLSPVMSLANFDGVVASAGAYGTRQGSLLWRETLDGSHTKQLVDYFHENQMPYFLQTERALCSDTRSTEEIKAAFEDLGRTWDEVKALFGLMVTSEDPGATEGVEKCCYFRCRKDAAVVQRELGSYFQVVDSSYKLTRFCDGEIMKAGVNKATGISRYLEAAGIDREDCIAFGDGPNDIEMLEYAHTGVCMGNGTDRTKAVADLVCGRIDEDGLYNAFLGLGLI